MYIFSLKVKNGDLLIEDFIQFIFYEFFFKVRRNCPLKENLKIENFVVEN